MDRKGTAPLAAKASSSVTSAALSNASEVLCVFV